MVQDVFANDYVAGRGDSGVADGFLRGVFAKRADEVRVQNVLLKGRLAEGCRSAGAVLMKGWAGNFLSQAGSGWGKAVSGQGRRNAHHAFDDVVDGSPVAAHFAW